VSDQPLLIIEPRPLDSTLILDHSPHTDQKTKQQSIRDNIFRSPYPFVRGDEVVCFCCEDEDGWGECPEEAED
jgi:hypothetical protein